MQSQLASLGSALTQGRACRRYPRRLAAHARAGELCSGRARSRSRCGKAPGSAETAVPAPRLVRRRLKPWPPPIVFLRDEGAELLGIGPRGSPGRHTVREQLSWRSWGKFCDFRRGRARSGAWGRRDGEGACGQAGMNGRPPSAPRLCGPLFPPRPSFPHCLLRSRGALCRARGPTLRVSQFPEWGRGRPAAPRMPPQVPPHPARPGPPRPPDPGLSGRLLRAWGASTTPWVPLIRPSPRASAGDAREQLSRADADGKHTRHRPPLGDAFGACSRGRGRRPERV